jgi:hypothetical protein
VEKAVEFSWRWWLLAPSASFPTGVWPAVLPPSSCGVNCLSAFLAAVDTGRSTDGVVVVVSLAWGMEDRRPATTW